MWEDMVETGESGYLLEWGLAWYMYGDGYIWVVLVVANTGLRLYNERMGDHDWLGTGKVFGYGTLPCFSLLVNLVWESRQMTGTFNQSFFKFQI